VIAFVARNYELSVAFEMAVGIAVGASADRC